MTSLPAFQKSAALMTDSPLIYFLIFGAAAATVIIAGAALSRYADAFSEATGLGRLWVGSIALAAATSLPELATDITAVRLESPNLAVGDLFGSSMANMLILAIIDLLPPRRGVLRQATIDQTLIAALAICLNALAAILIFIRPNFTVFGVSPGSLLIFISYVVGMWAIYQYLSSPDRKINTIEPNMARQNRKPLRPIVVRFLVATGIIFIAAPSLAWSAKGIAEITGLGSTFVGTLLVGLVTSLPELASCLAAVRIGAFDLAVGNLFGSNAFNMAIFFPLDIAVTDGSIYTFLDTNHVLSALISVILMALGSAAIVYRAKGRRPLLEPDSILMLMTYLGGISLLFFYSLK
jgi:cation:H+ antiporter